MDTHTGTETQALVEMRELIRSPERVGPRAPNSSGDPLNSLRPLDPLNSLRPLDPLNSLRPLDPLNSLRPFSTALKPTCGFSFSQDTDHRRKHNDLESCNPNKWRSASKPQ